MRSAGGFTGGRFVLPSSTPLRPDPGDPRYLVTGTSGGQIRGSGDRGRPKAQTFVTKGGTLLVRRGEADATSASAATSDAADASTPTEKTSATIAERLISATLTVRPGFRLESKPRTDRAPLPACDSVRECLLSLRANQSGDGRLHGGVDAAVVRLLTRYPVSLVIVLAAVGAVAAVFTFARPQMESEPGTEMVNLAEKDYISPAAVRAAFAAEGLPLRYTTGSPPLFVLHSDPPPQTADKLSVLVGARTGLVGFGGKHNAYDERFENVMVTYGGSDEALLARIKAAVATLKN